MDPHPLPVTVDLIQGEGHQYLIVEAEVNLGSEYVWFRRVIRDGDDHTLFQAIREGLSERVLGGAWEEVP